MFETSDFLIRCFWITENEYIFYYLQDTLLKEVGDPDLKPTFNAHEWAVPLSAYDDNEALREELNILSTSKDA